VLNSNGVSVKRAANITGLLCGIFVYFASSLASAQSPVRIAIYGDQGINSNARAVIDLARRESADLILVLGDLAYEQGTASEWIAQYDEILGNDFPVLAVVGNHEEDRWPNFKSILTSRLQRTPSVSCQGDYGVKNTCRINGVTIVGTAPGINEVPGIDGQDDYAGYIRNVLSNDDAPFSICSWHKNMRDMQLGGKGDATGWGVYEACRENGALVMTGHEHSYSRTHLMSSFEQQIVNSRSNDLTLSEGTSIAVVSGLGGVGPRVQLRDGDWWASRYTADQDATRGALFCDFAINGAPDRGACYFKNIRDEVIDRFQLTSRVNDNDNQITNLTRRVSASDDDAEERVSDGDAYVLSSDLELTEELDAAGQGRGQQLIGLRFDAMTIPRRAEILSAFLKFEVDEAGSRDTNLRIHGEASDNAVAYSKSPFEISSRPRTAAAVSWNQIPAVEPNDSLRSPDLKSLVQEIVDRPGWQAGSALALTISGTGQRVVESFDGEADAAASLFVEYRNEQTQEPSKFSVSDLSVDESAGIARAVVTATPAPTQTARIWIATNSIGASAEAGRDYYGTSKYLEFDPGVSQQSIDITIVDDTVLESTEFFNARIFKPDFGSITRSNATVSIVDDDRGARELSVSDVTVDEGAGSATVTLRLSPAATTRVEVAVATSPESAVNGKDFYGVYRKVSFEPGQTSQTVVVEIVDDLEVESATEFFNVRLFDPVGASLQRSLAKINITDND